MSEVRTMATEYTVCALPEDNINHYLYEVKVQYRGKGRWAVSDGFRRCLGTDGDWDFESIPSERTDEWLATHRFELAAALLLAEQEAPKVVVNGITVEQALARGAS